MATFIQPGLGLELEAPINPKSSFVFRSGWIPMNRDLPYHNPGTYQQTYTSIFAETTNWFFGWITNKSMTFSPEPFAEIGEFLPTSVIPLQASVKAYIGKKESNNRFFIQYGIRVLHFRGLSIANYQILLNKTTTNIETGPVGTGIEYTETTTTTYQQTRTARSGVKRTVGGLAFDFGWRFRSKRRMTFDLGIRTGWNDSKGIYGLNKWYFTPMLNLGIRI